MASVPSNGKWLGRTVLFDEVCPLGGGGRSRIPGVSLVLVAGAVITGCSFGHVSDGNGNAIGGAQLEFQEWHTGEKVAFKDDTVENVPPNFVPTFGDPYVSVKTHDPAVNAGDPQALGYWWLNQYQPVAVGDPTPGRLVVPGWHRIRVSKSGFDDRYIYRNHLYELGPVLLGSPYSGGQYPAVQTGQTFGLIALANEIRLYPSNSTHACVIS